MLGPLSDAMTATSTVDYISGKSIVGCALPSANMLLVFRSNMMMFIETVRKVTVFAGALITSFGNTVNARTQIAFGEASAQMITKKAIEQSVVSSVFGFHDSSSRVIEDICLLWLAV